MNKDKSDCETMKIILKLIADKVVYGENVHSLARTVLNEVQSIPGNDNNDLDIGYSTEIVDLEISINEITEMYQFLDEDDVNRIRELANKLLEMTK